MPVVFLDPLFEQEVRADRERRSVDRWDEVWDGVLVVPPTPNNEHQQLVLSLAVPLATITDRRSGDQVLPGANVGDRETGWASNYRIPDVAVYLAANPARDLGTHFAGGPDLAVEIISPGENPLAKLDFYAKAGTRELLVVDRKPWGLELYRLVAGRLVSIGRSDANEPAVLASSALPVSFRLCHASPRPMIVVTHAVTGRVWTA